MDKGTLVGHVARELKLPAKRVRQIIALLEDGGTVPFIARYRKDSTGNLGEGAIRRVREALSEFDALNDSKAAAISNLEASGGLTEDLKRKIEKAHTAESLSELVQSDLDRTASDKAREQGLTQLAMMLRMQRNPYRDIESLAQRLVDPDKGLPDIAAVFQGAVDIIALQIAEDAENRQFVEDYIFKRVRMVSKVVPGQEEEGKAYEQYFDFTESARDIAGRQIMSIRRGASQGFLTFEMQVSVERALKQFQDRLIHTSDDKEIELLGRAVQQAFEKALFPPVLERIRKICFRSADMESVMTCKKNLRNLLLSPPGKGRRVLGIDPAFKGGCRMAAVDSDGNVIELATIYLGQSKKRKETARERIQQLVETHDIDAVGIGKGAGHRQIEDIVQEVMSGIERQLLKVTVNRSGVDEYGKSALGAAELPEAEEASRAAVSIARRFQDPLFEMAKVDPWLLQVGPYQSEICPDLLKEKMSDVMESCISFVGLDLNSASEAHLAKLPGSNNEIAAAIANRRTTLGPFKNRAELKSVDGIDDQAFTQMAGFVRINDGEEPLDRTGIHPEDYELTRKIAAEAGHEIGSLIGNAEAVEKIDWEKYVNEEVGRRTVKLIRSELLKPGEDPRGELQVELFESGLQSAKQLFEGMILPGSVTNVTKFGAFIDLGSRLEGLVHVSQLSKRFVKDPTRVVHVGDRVMVKVLRIDKDKKRISLSVKQAKGKEPSPIPPLAEVDPPKPVIVEDKVGADEQVAPVVAGEVAAANEASSATAETSAESRPPAEPQAVAAETQAALTEPVPDELIKEPEAAASEVSATSDANVAVVAPAEDDAVETPEAAPKAE